MIEGPSQIYSNLIPTLIILLINQMITTFKFWITLNNYPSSTPIHNTFDLRFNTTLGVISFIIILFPISDDQEQNKFDRLNNF